MPGTLTWQWIAAEARRRVAVRQWPPGSRIPDEAQLAAEFGCARATVNRALRELAAAGLLVRRRRAGSFVAELPVRKATFEIQVIRQEIAARGLRPGYRLLEAASLPVPAPVRDLLGLAPGTPFRHLRALHLADDRPFCLEDRWLNPATPGLEGVDFAAVSANEWLVRNRPFSSGTIAFFALAADPGLAALLDCRPGEALFAVERATFAGADPITAVRLTYGPGHRVTAPI
ncbi:MAG: UTRA domain-containing protein [Rhodobacteraceae bacterium]|nr:UTRA domain-containing protein [Paracoccaceae bacterium]